MAARGASDQREHAHVHLIYREESDDSQLRRSETCRPARSGVVSSFGITVGPPARG